MVGLDLQLRVAQLYRIMLIHLMEVAVVDSFIILLHYQYNLKLVSNFKY